MNKIIVSRHQSAIEFIRRERPDFADAPIFEAVNAADVRGAVVAGNLPLHLAAEADTVLAVEFTGQPPRGTEYTLADMDAAGASIRAYRVTGCEIPVAVVETVIDFSDGETYTGNGGGSSRRPAMLVFLSDGVAVPFVGKSIPGVCRVMTSRNLKMGRWSHCEYQLKVAGDGYLFEGGWIRSVPGRMPLAQVFHALDFAGIPEPIWDVIDAANAARIRQAALPV